MTTPIAGKVAQVVSERELVINRGSEHGVTVGMRFRILAPEPSVVTDPETEEELGEVDLTKIEVEVVEVQPKLSVCATFKKVTVPGQAPRPGITSSYSSLAASIFGAPGTPDTERFQTLRSDEPYVINEINPADSFIKRGDRAVQVVRRQELED